MENKAHALAAGTFVLVVAELLVTLAVWLTRETGVQTVFEVSSSEAVTGLQPQAAVRYRGVNVGKVESIAFDPEKVGSVLLRISVDEATPITHSSFATLGFQGVTGIAFVQLDDSGESKERMTSSPTHMARIPMRPNLVNKLAERGSHLLTQIELIIERVNQSLVPENQSLVMKSVASLGRAADSLPPLVHEARKTLVSLREVSTSVVATTDAAKKSVDQATVTATELNRLVQGVQQPGAVLDQLTQGAGALTAAGQALQMDTLPRLNRAMDDTSLAARNLSRVANTLESNPQALILGNPATNLAPVNRASLPQLEEHHDTSIASSRYVFRSCLRNNHKEFGRIFYNFGGLPGWLRTARAQPRPRALRLW